MREEIITQLDIHKLSPEEKTELETLVDGILHHHVLTLILDHLPANRHSEFITYLHRAPFDPGLLDYLKLHVPDIENKIKSTAGKVKKALLKEVRHPRRSTTGGAKLDTTS